MEPYMKLSNRHIFMKRNQDTILAYAILAVVFTLFAMNQQDFFSRYGLQSIFNQVITLSIVAFAQTLVILTSGIDLSVGAQVGVANSLAATIMGTMIHTFGSSLAGVLVTIFLVLLLGVVTGLINGLLIVYGRLQPIIVTLATSSIFLGVALYIRPVPGGNVIEGYSHALSGRLFTYIPVAALILLVLIVVVWIPLRRSRLGQDIYAVGGNEYSAYLSGININRTKLRVYILAGILCACAGIELTAQTASGDPLGSSLFTLHSIAAVVLGGTLLSGGRGSYIGSVAGAFILSLILGLLIFWGGPSFYQNAVQGLILIFALAVGVIQPLFKRRKKI